MVGADPELFAHLAQVRPRTRGDCIDGPRPCPWVSCRQHLLIELHESGGERPLRLRLNGRGVDGLRPAALADECVDFFEVAVERLWQLEHSCTLDAADDGARRAGAVAGLLGVSRPRVMQELEAAMASALEVVAAMGIDPVRCPATAREVG